MFIDEVVQAAFKNQAFRQPYNLLIDGPFPADAWEYEPCLPDLDGFVDSPPPMDEHSDMSAFEHHVAPCHFYEDGGWFPDSAVRLCVGDKLKERSYVLNEERWLHIVVFHRNMVIVANDTFKMPVF